jgi:FMN phosphatase YigB (HAD superfamily)
MTLQAVAFDWGHTIMDEVRDRGVPLDERPIHLMPFVLDVLPQLTLPLAVWANTQGASSLDVHRWLERAGIGRFFRWVVTSVEAGARKPSLAFFEYALGRAGVGPPDILFVGNQRNTDIAGAQAAGIQSVWLSGPKYRSGDDGHCDATPTYVIPTLLELPLLLRQILSRTSECRP